MKPSDPVRLTLGKRVLYLTKEPELIQPGCGACIGCGPGVSESAEEVAVSTINRNYKGRSGPGKLYLASPLSVAASAFTGYITAYRPGMFAGGRPA
jgi:3-isopropylmalate/(R)-2-methylmalate dehydratase large subunit